MADPFRNASGENYAREVAWNGYDSGLTPDVVEVLNQAQQLVDFPINLISGYRDPARNKRVGGAKQSQHMEGKAVDISLKGLSDAQRTQLTRALAQAGAKRLGAYSGNTSMHLDMKPGPTAKGYPVWPMFDTKFQNMGSAHKWFVAGLDGGKIPMGSVPQAANGPVPANMPTNVANTRAANADLDALAAIRQWAGLDPEPSIQPAAYSPTPARYSPDLAFRRQMAVPAHTPVPSRASDKTNLNFPKGEEKGRTLPAGKIGAPRPVEPGAFNDRGGTFGVPIQSVARQLPDPSKVQKTFRDEAARRAATMMPMSGIPTLPPLPRSLMAANDRDKGVQGATQVASLGTPGALPTAGSVVPILPPRVGGDIIANTFSALQPDRMTVADMYAGMIPPNGPTSEASAPVPATRLFSASDAVREKTKSVVASRQTFAGQDTAPVSKVAPVPVTRTTGPMPPSPMPRSMRPADPGLNGNPSFHVGTRGLPVGLPPQAPPPIKPISQLYADVPPPRPRPATSLPFAGQGLTEGQIRAIRGDLAVLPPMPPRQSSPASVPARQVATLPQIAPVPAIRRAPQYVEPDNPVSAWWDQTPLGRMGAAMQNKPQAPWDGHGLTGFFLNAPSNGGRPTFLESLRASRQGNQQTTRAPARPSLFASLFGGGAFGNQSTAPRNATGTPTPVGGMVVGNAVFSREGGGYGSDPGQVTRGLKPGDRVYDPDRGWGLKLK